MSHKSVRLTLLMVGTLQVCVPVGPVLGRDLLADVP